ncbi:MAG: hypothetical protein H0W70_05145 [Actinobacteria bacterium]|nr:hypothetical protein [Actinomycetota bacterium]
MATYERFTDKARRVLMLSQQLAAERGHFIDAEHMLEALAATEGIGSKVLAEAKLNPDVLRERMLGEHPAVDRQRPSEALASFGIDVNEVQREVADVHGENAARMAGDSQPPFSVEGKRTLEQCIRAMTELGHEHIGTEHLLLAVLSQRDSVATQVIRDLGADSAALEARVRELVSQV